jgi:tetratricopeptide (TPR) repeat protein
MEYKMSKKKVPLTLFAAFFLLLILYAAAGSRLSISLCAEDGQAAAPVEALDIEKAYRDARFPILAEHLNKKDYTKLSTREKLLLIECSARTAQGPLVLEKMKAILAGQKTTGEILTTAGILSTSLGRLAEAGAFIKQALTMDPNSPRALLAQAMLHLYYQKYSEAETCAAKLVEHNPGWQETNLYLFAGLEIYKGSRNPQKLKEVYDLLARKNKKSDKRYYQNFKANSRFLKKAKKGGLFDIETLSDRVVVPFADPSLGDNDKKTIHLKVKGKTFKVLLDTGNAVGWFIYSRELRELLKTVKGGRAFTRMGIEDSTLEGCHIFCESIDFGDFIMARLAGQFLAKPHPDFYDANLNPLFIRGRVITLDFIKQQMVLTTKKRFDTELSTRQGLDIVKLPWYGYERAFVPVRVFGAAGLAMIETGAEDISLKLDFAQALKLPLKKQDRYLANGKVFHFFKTPVSLSAGTFFFRRRSAEVWPLNRIYNPVTGMTADVMIGPAAWQGKFILSFDPFDRKVILEAAISQDKLN